MDSSWKIDQFSKLNRLISESLRCSEDDSQIVSEMLKSSLSESEIKLACLSEIPKPDHKHLTDLDNGKVLINSQEFKVNAEFIEETKKVSQFLDIDEFLAATLVHEGIPYESKLERPIAECAVLLFFSETQKMALCIDNILSGGVNLSLPDQIRTTFLDFSERLLSSTIEKSDKGDDIRFNGGDSSSKEMFPTRVLNSITKIKQFSEKILGKATTFSSTFGNEVISEILSSLEDERRILSSIFYTIVSDYRLNSSELLNLVNYAKNAEVSDELTLRIVPSILSSLDTSIQVDLEPGSCESMAFDKTSMLASDPDFMLKLNNEIINSEWKIPELKGLVKLQWSLTSLYGIKRVPGFAESIGYQEDIAEQHIEDAILMDSLQFAYEYLLAFKHQEGCRDSNELDNRLLSNSETNILFKQTSTRKFPAFLDVDETFQQSLEKRLSNLVYTYIIMASNVIRKVRHSEEDIIMKYQQQKILQLQSEQQIASQKWYGVGRLQTPREVPGINRSSNSPPIIEPKRYTESLFRFISTLFKDRIDSGLRFWVPSNTGIPDVDDRLLVFIRWGSDMREQGMVESFINMLASLSTGPQSSQCAHEFMITGGGKLLDGNRANSKLPLCSWDSLFSALDFYEQMLQKSKSDPLSPAPEIPEAEIKVIDAFLILLKQVMTYSFSARMVIYENKDLQVMWTLFSLLGCPVPISTKSRILDAISSFVSSPYPIPDQPNIQHIDEMRDTFEVCQNVWRLLEQSQALPTASDISFANVGQWGWQSRGGIVYELEEIEASTGFFPETRSFLGLLNALIHLDINSAPLDDLEKDPLIFSFSSPSIPTDLGKDYRIPGISPYISFVLDNIIGKLNKRVYSNDWEKWSIASNSLLLIERCLASMILPTKSGEFNVSNYQLLVTHPGFEICIRILCGADLIQNLFNIVRLGVDSINTSKGYTGELMSDSVLFALRIFVRVIKVQNSILNVVIPELLELNSHELYGLPLSLPRSLTTLENLFLLQTDVVVHIASYINSIRSPQICEVSVKLISLLSLSPEFNGPNNELKISSGKFITTVNKLVNILENSQESSRIMHGYISRLEQDDGDFFENLIGDSISNPKNALDGSIFGYANGISDKLISKSSSGVCLAIMNLILSNLESGKSYPTIAHWLLGFDLQETYVRDLPDPLTKSTCLHSILNLLSQGSSLDPGKINRNELLINTRPLFAESCYKLVHLLSINSVTGDVFLRYLRRKEDFALSQLQSLLIFSLIGIGADARSQMMEMLKNPSKSSSFIDLFQFQPTRAFFQFMSYFWFFQYFSHELHLSSINGNRTRVQNMVEIMLQSSFSSSEDSPSFTAGFNYSKKGGTIFNQNNIINCFTNMRDAFSECLLVISLKSKRLSLLLGSEVDVVGLDSESLKTKASKFNIDLSTILTSSKYGCLVYNIQSLLSFIKNSNQSFGSLPKDNQSAIELNSLVLGCFFSNLKHELYQSYSKARYGWKQVIQVMATSSWNFIPESKISSEGTSRKSQLCLDILNSIYSEVFSPPPPLNTIAPNSFGNYSDLGLNDIFTHEDELWSSEMSSMLSTISVLYSERLSAEIYMSDNSSESKDDTSISSSAILIEPIAQVWRNMINSLLSESSKYSMDLRVNIYSSILHLLSGIQALNTSKPLPASPFNDKQGFGTIGTTNSQTRSQKLVQRVLEELTATPVGEQILDCVSIDILDGTDVCKAVSLSLLNSLSSLYSVEPRNRLVPYLSRHNYIGQFIDLLRNLNSNLVSLLTPNTNPSNSLHIYESMMTFFLRLSYRKVGIEKLLEGGILECLSSCEFINCRPQGNVNSKISIDNGLIDRLDTYNKLFLPVINLLSAIMTKIGGDDIYSLNRIYRFVTLNYSPFENILKEVSTHDSTITKQILSEAKSITRLISLLFRHQTIIEKSFSDSSSGVLSIFNLHIPIINMITRFGINDEWLSHVVPINDEDKEMSFTPSLFLISINSASGKSTTNDSNKYSTAISDAVTSNPKFSVLSQLCISTVNSLLTNVVLYSYSISQPLTNLGNSNNQINKPKNFRPTFSWNIDDCRETDMYPSLASLCSLLSSSVFKLQSYQQLLSTSINKSFDISFIPMTDLKKLAISALPRNSELLLVKPSMDSKDSYKPNPTGYVELASDVSNIKVLSLASDAIKTEISESKVQISFMFIIIEQSLLLLQTHLQYYYSYGIKYNYSHDDIYNSDLNVNNFHLNSNDDLDNSETNPKNFVMNNGFPSNLVKISRQDLNVLKSDASIVLPSLINLLDNLGQKEMETVLKNNVSTPTANRTLGSDFSGSNKKITHESTFSAQYSFIKTLSRRIKSLIFCDE
ncbi:Nuclear pore complex protein [Smittium mucronatum]|uniref:Nuclear pore complex protein n=1 Tax=Smittium mucronatum TaxID=133383 RepID=A0A1R0GZ77_9FUNG|nr:Nuclear pore complex protein [Smittium mucronatum]